MSDLVDVWIMRSPPKPLPRAEKLLAPILHGYRGEISRSSLGRPQLSVPGLDMSVSHSHKIWLAAFAHDRKIGVDIERVRAEFDFDSIVRDHFLPSEQNIWLASKKNLEVFFHVWTQKEAVTKALGLGLTMPLLEIEVEADPTAGCRLIYLKGHDPKAWILKSLVIDPDYKSVLAIQGADATINYRFYEKSLVLPTAST